MDHRMALRPQTPLRFYKRNGEVIQCAIEQEIGRGGSCIVYEVSREAETGDITLYRLKELYPYKMNIKRDYEGELIISDDEKSAFVQQQKQFDSDYSLANKLFYSGKNYSSTVNYLDIYYLNGTSYSLSTYSSKNTLATYKPETLKECISLVKHVAYVLNNVHKEGYLYLDTKPDNILVVDGLEKQIQLFDFNSLVSLSELKKMNERKNGEIRLSFTKGFAPIELQTSKIKKLGPHTDVFGVGALLFYLIFGATPCASDCETDAILDYTNIRFGDSRYDDKLFQSLTEFFNNALAIYYGDRYQSMDEAYEKLEEIEKFADITRPCIFSTEIIRPNFVFGRELDFEKLDQYLCDDTYNCTFITGMGGIGKSTFIREYLCRNKNKFDKVLYMYFKDNIENTIIDDNNIEINTLRLEDQSSNGDRYFIKKIKKIRELSRNTSTVIVIDNFSGEVDSDLRELLTTGCKIILITRSTPSYQNCHKLQINSISDYESLLQIFEKNLGRRITKEEESDFHEIVEYIDGHTFVLELIAKQIANNGKLTITSASELTKKHGFSSIAPEKVSIEMDNQTKSDTIANIIDELFKAGNLTENQKIFMKVASLIGDKGIDINYFHQILKIECKDDANELIKDGWLMFADEKISMHRVIQDSIQRWEWTPAYLSMAECFLSYFYIEIHLESTKNNYPRKLRDNLLLSEKLQSLAMQKGKIYKKFYERFNLMIEKQEQKTLIGRVAMEREKRIHDTNPADLKKLMALLSQAEDIITKCKRDQIIKNTEVYVNLLYVTLLNTPDYKEDYILDETTDMFSNDNFDFIRKGTDELIESDLSRNAITLFRLYAKVILVHAERGRIEESEIMLEQANRFSKSARHSRVTALYYNLLSNFYDILLNGAYDTTDSNEEFLLNNMLDAIDKTLQYSKKFISRDEDHLYANNILAKATILMRSGRGKKEEIEKLLETAQKVVSENTSPYADVRLVFYLVYAWYFALLLNSGEAADICIQKAKGLSDYILQNSLQKIEMIIIPCANIYFETGMHKEATTLLHEGISLCAKYPNNEFYAQIKRELCDHIWEVAREFGEYDLCNTIIAEIDHDNESVVDSKNKVVIPEDVRLLISTNTTN